MIVVVKELANQTNGYSVYNIYSLTKNIHGDDYLVFIKSYFTKRYKNYFKVDLEFTDKVYNMSYFEHRQKITNIAMTRFKRLSLQGGGLSTSQMLTLQEVAICGDI